MPQTNRTVFLGFIAGFLGGAILVAVARPGAGGPSGKIVARMDGAALTEKELRSQITPNLIPIENDEFQVLQGGLMKWIETRLFEREAKARGVDVAEMDKEVWRRVHVSYDEILGTYNRDRAAYSELPFEKASGLIAAQVRSVKYLDEKQKFLQELRQKYHIQILLEPPKSYVPGLALPQVTGVPGEEGPNPAALPETPPGGPPPTQPPPALPTPPSPEPTNVPAIVNPPTAPATGPENAPITLTEFADFHCSFCKQVAPTLEQLVQNYPGKIRFVFRHFPLSPTPGSGSFLTHEASVCAHEQGKFWTFYDEVFRLPNSPQPGDLEPLAGKAGVDLNKYRECMQSKRSQSVIQQDLNKGRQKGIQGTPTIYVNNQSVNGAYPYNYFVNLVDNILTPGKAPAPTPPPAPNAPQPAPPPGVPVQFDDLKGRPSLGPEKAPITLVEFSDFHCPFCQRVGPTIDQLMKNYQGKIRRVWRHYPLPFHAGSDRTHQASECAHEQGKFWEYHDKLFQTLGSARDDQALTNLATEVGLDKKKFEQCLSSGQYKDLVQQEISKGNQVGVHGTPTFFVNGQIVPGAVPYETFDSIVKSELAKKS